MSLKPSILHIIDSLNHGGAEKVTITLANLFFKKGHEVGVLYFFDTEQNIIHELNPEIKIFKFNRGWKYNIFKKNNFQQITKQYDLIHVHMKHNLRYVWFLRLFRNEFPKIFFQDHGFSNLNYFDLKITRVALSKAVYIGVNDILCKTASQYFKVKNPYLLPNTIDQVSPKEKNKKERNKFKLVLVSNIHKRKNILFALKYFFHLIKIDKSYELDIIGKIRDEKYYQNCKSYCKNKGLVQKIKFIHDQKNVQQLLLDYDMGLHFSSLETGPIVLIEYFAQGLPFLSYGTGQVYMDSKKLFSKFFIRSCKIEKWVKRTMKIRTQIGSELSHEMKNYFQYQFSIEKYYENCLNIYQKNLI